MENEEIETPAKVGFFTDDRGLFSMRRLLAFLLAITAIGLSIGCLVCAAEWKTALVIIGLPLISSLLFMFFTTWGDVAKVVNFGKNKGDN